jgi:sigma-B regulation protein RsbU (phosphoserine phosphatase)
MYRKALQRELEIGREIQAGFLPEALPQVDGWEIVPLLRSAREVAGDFYDVFELPDGTIGLVIADVCDKGVGAALFMTLFRSLIRVTATRDTFEHTSGRQAPCCAADRLLHAMAQTNDYIAETHGKSGMFATLFFGILDPQNGSLTYVNGGHEPPILLRGGSVWDRLPKTGPAVGAILHGSFLALETKLDPGDLLLAYTDGVTEAKNPQEDFFGHERLRAILERGIGSAYDLVGCVESDLRRFIGNAIQFDDITLLAVRRK